MENCRINIGTIPALVWGRHSAKVFLYVHGQGGNKEEAALLAEKTASWGQVLSIDLPGHGERTAEKDHFDPWHAVPELEKVYSYAAERWDSVALFANSIGAWFSLLALANKPLKRALFLSPVLDMAALIGKMMLWASVTEDDLRRRSVIETQLGYSLSWDYLTFARQSAISEWPTPTEILYASADHLIDRSTVDSFAARFDAGLTVMDGGEHWFHTPEQLDVLRNWLDSKLASDSL